MINEKQTAKALITAVGVLIQEWEGAKTLPNTVFMSPKNWELVKKYAPYMAKDHNLLYNNKTFRVVLVADKTFFGIGLTFYTDYIEDYENTSLSK